VCAGLFVLDFQAIFYRHIRSSQIATHNIIIIPATSDRVNCLIISQECVITCAVFILKLPGRNPQKKPKNFSETKSFKVLVSKDLQNGLIFVLVLFSNVGQLSKLSNWVVVLLFTLRSKSAREFTVRVLKLLQASKQK
jgi:hypothetical protein